MRRITRVSASLTVAALGLVSVAGCGSSSPSGGSSGKSGGGSGKTHIVLGQAATNVNTVFTQAYVAAVDKYFEKHGLDADIKAVGTSLSSEIARGDIDLAVATPASAYPLQQAGKKVTILYNMNGGGLAGAVVAASPKITEVSQCKSVVTSVAGTTQYAWARLYQQLFHTNYKIVLSTDTAALTPTLLSGRVDCAVGGYSVVNPAVLAKKAHYVFDPSKPATRPAGFPATAMETAVWGTDAAIKKLGPKTVGQVIAAMKDAATALRSQSSAQLAETVSKYPGVKEGTVSEMTAAIQLERQFFAPNDGYMSDSDWNDSRSFFQHGGYGYMTPSNPKFAYKSLIDMSYLKPSGAGS